MPIDPFRDTISSTAPNLNFKDGKERQAREFCAVFSGENSRFFDFDTLLLYVNGKQTQLSKMDKPC